MHSEYTTVFQVNYDAFLTVSKFGEAVQQYYPLVKTEVCLIMLLELLKLAGD